MTRPQYLACLLLWGCQQESPEWEGDSVPSSTCIAPLVQLQTGSDETCSGGASHFWPVVGDTDDCHGWSAADSDGDTHSNSADQITCHDDGSFSFEQYANTLDCSGDGVLKTYYPDECEQDIPPSLYTVAVDLRCCTDPDSADCIQDVPSVSQPGASIYQNNALCEE